MRILIVANGYPPTAMGGVEIYTAELSRYLVSQGHQVTVFCRESDFSRPDYTINTEYLDQVKIVRVVNDYKDPHSFRKTIVDPHLEQIFDEFLESEQPDLIHFNHLIALSAQLPLIAATRNIPTMITLHDFWPICHRINLIDWRGQICPGPLQGVNCAACVVRGNLRQKAAQAVGTTLYKLKGYLSNRKQSPDGTSLLETADPPPALASFPKIYADRLDLFTRAVLACRRILVPSEYVRSQYSVNGIPFDRIDVIPLGIEPVPAAQALRPTSGNLTFATIGPLQPIKGMDLVIKAFRLVSGDHLRLKIFGRTDLFPRDHARQIIDLARSDPRISLMGPFPPDERDAVYASFDILVVPSRAPETFSLVTREALARGKPVIAARIGAFPEIIQDGVNGFLFPPGDVQALAGLMTGFTNDRTLINQLSIPGPAQTLETTEHGEQIQMIYRQISGNL